MSFHRFMPWLKPMSILSQQLDTIVLFTRSHNISIVFPHNSGKRNSAVRVSGQTWAKSSLLATATFQSYFEGIYTQTRWSVSELHHNHNDAQTTCTTLLVLPLPPLDGKLRAKLGRPMAQQTNATIFTTTEVKQVLSQPCPIRETIPGGNNTPGLVGKTPKGTPSSWHAHTVY